ncbi:hypothetical protein C8R43DRAFT_1028261 [Mycena crocata]|nr:hypothetical protein C8R43DRAFT_1028261 [Mycena crocata]
MSDSGTREADRARLTEIDDAISALKQAINVLRIEKKAIQERLYTYRYPVLTLPNEITSEIFIHFLPLYPSCPSFTGLLSPTILTHICRQWRQIALATPLLWRAISLDLVTPHLDDNLVQWVERTGSCPLSIQVGNSSYSPHWKRLETLIPHRARWEYLAINSTRKDVLLCCLRDPLRALLRLELSIDAEFEGTLLPPLSLGEAPMLQSAVVNHYATHVILPWAQLTSLTLQSVFPHECTPVLQQTSALLCCTLILYPARNPHQLPEPDVTLSHLQSMVLVRNEEGKPVTGYIETLVVPALRTLRIPDAFLGPDPTQTLTSFIAKSGCTLEQLRITGEASVSRATYRAAFPSIPMLSFPRRIADGDEGDSEGEEDSDGSSTESVSESESE